MLLHIVQSLTLYGIRTISAYPSEYIDDSYLQGDDVADCVANFKATVNAFDSLGLITHPEKSVLIPTQQLTYPGFILDSVEIKIFLTPEKIGDT